MDITILGATGRTGVHVVRLGVARGHRLRLLVRDGAAARRRLGGLLDAAGAPGGRVELVVGDARHPADLSRAVDGAEAVVSALGPVRGSPPDLMRRSATATVEAVRSLPRRRLVWLTGAGVRRPGDTPGAADRVIVGVMTVVAPKVLRDSREGVAVVTAADDVDWTVVRAPRLTDEAASGRLRVAERVGGGHGTTLPRADLAGFLLDVATTGQHRHASPVVSA